MLITKIYNNYMKETLENILNLKKEIYNYSEKFVNDVIDKKINDFVDNFLNLLNTSEEVFKIIENRYKNTNTKIENKKVEWSFYGWQKMGDFSFSFLCFGYDMMSKKRRDTSKFPLYLNKIDDNYSFNPSDADNFNFLSLFSNKKEAYEKIKIYYEKTVNSIILKPNEVYSYSNILEKYGNIFKNKNFIIDYRKINSNSEFYNEVKELKNKLPEYILNHKFEYKYNKYSILTDYQYLLDNSYVFNDMIQQQIKDSSSESAIYDFIFNFPLKKSSINNFINKVTNIKNIIKENFKEIALSITFNSSGIDEYKSDITFIFPPLLDNFYIDLSFYKINTKGYIYKKTFSFNVENLLNKVNNLFNL